MTVKLDLHIHSKFSGDSNSDPASILSQAKRAGLGGIAVVDHGTIKGGEETAKLNGNEDFLVIPGAEIRTDKGEILGYFLNEEIESRSLLDVIDEMRAQDALISIPHPFDSLRFNRLKDPLEIVSKIDSVEVFNSRCMFENFNKKALKFSEEHGLGFTAGSDAHHIEEIGASGITIKGDRIRDEIMKNKDFFGSKNPLLIHAKTSLQRLIPR